VGGDPHIGSSIISIAIVEFNSDHITVENRVISKFWADPNEMEEHANDTWEEIVRTKRKTGRPPKGTGKSKKKLLRRFSLQSKSYVFDARLCCCCVLGGIWVVLFVILSFVESKANVF